MSTLKTSNIQDTSGNNNSTPEEIGKGRAKAWINLNGDNTPTARESYNVSSITDNATGDYTFNFTNAMSSSDFAWAVSIGDQNHSSTVRQLSYISSSTTSLRLLSETSNGSNIDEANVCVVVFGA